MRLSTLAASCLPLLFVSACAGQPTPSTDPSLPQQQGGTPESEQKRIFGVIPNYRTYPTLQDYKPISSRQKFMIAAQDSFDRGSVILAALFAGKSYLSNDNPSFGHGAAGISRYFGTAYGDIVIGNFMTESIYPTLLRQDPRYFRRGTGTGLSRTGYAISRIFWTRTDSGHAQFNFSEVGGNATAAAIANAYYPDNRTARDAASKLGIQLGIDIAGNLLKEFWPDLNRKFSRKHKP
jgi:hypothetical protein